MRNGSLSLMLYTSLVLGSVAFANLLGILAAKEHTDLVGKQYKKEKSSNSSWALEYQIFKKKIPDY